MALRNSLLALASLQLLLPLVLGNSNITNYTVGFKVSSLWGSGSSDDLYWQLCNDDYVIGTVVMNTSNGTNTTTLTGKCTEWYLIEDGMPNEGSWNSFDFNNIDNINPITSARLLTKGTDAFWCDPIPNLSLSISVSPNMHCDSVSLCAYTLCPSVSPSSD